MRGFRKELNRRCEVIQISGTRHAKDPGDAINQEAGGEGSKNEILGACFQGGLILTQIGDQDVERDGGKFQGHKNHDEINRLHHPHQPRAGENGQNGKFPNATTSPLGRNISFQYGTERGCHQDNHNGAYQKKADEEEGQEIRGYKSCNWAIR